MEKNIAVREQLETQLESAQIQKELQEELGVPQQPPESGEPLGEIPSEPQV